MSTRDRDITYLDRFLHDLWPLAADLLGNDVSHTVMEQANERGPGPLRVRQELEVGGRPRIEPDGDDGLRVRIPGEGGHAIGLQLLPPKVSRPRLGLRIDLAIELAVSATEEPDPELHLDIDGGVVGDVVGWCTDWEDQVESGIADQDLEKELGFLTSMRYDPDAVPEIPRPERAHPHDVHLEDGINIVLVPEAFPADDLGGFEAIVEALVARLTTPEGNRANEPFHSFRSALNVWTITPDQGDDHVVAAHTDPRGSRRVALGNLARLAAVGRSARSLGHRTVLAVLADKGSAAFTGGKTPRAMALGDVILQPTTGSLDDDVDTLLHELAHTGLGRLRDEYVEEARKDVHYLGDEPQAPNLTTDADLGKWERWVRSPELPHWDDHPVVGVEGAGYFGGGMWRPAEACKMGKTPEPFATVPLCAVCRETLTNGMRSWLPEDQFVIAVTGHADERQLLQVEPGRRTDGRLFDHVFVPADETVDVEVEVVAATLPEPWDLSADLQGEGTLTTRESGRPRHGPGAPRPTWSFPASAGDRLVIDVGSDCPFTPWDDLPHYTIDLSFRRDRDEGPQPSTPVDLSARQVFRKLPRQPQPVKLTATSDFQAGKELQFEFQVALQAQRFPDRVGEEQSRWLHADSRTVTATVSHSVPQEGDYQFRARASNRNGATSSWSQPMPFAVHAKDVDDRRPPVEDPTDPTNPTRPHDPTDPTEPSRPVQPK